MNTLIVGVQFFESVAVIVAAGTAVYSLNRWRREFLGTRRIELAEEVLQSFYEARDAVSWMRFPAARVSEGTTRPAEAGELPEEKRRRNLAYVPIERYESKSELWSRIGVLKYRCEARFGTESIAPFDELRKILAEILVAARILGKEWAHEARGGHYLDSDRVKKSEAVIWEEDDDPLREKLDKVIAVVEGYFKPIVVKSGRANRQ